MSAHDHWDEDDDRPPPYSRPTASAWVAAAAVFVAIFVLGGYIKTYRQYEKCKAESRLEIQNLTQELNALRSAARERAGERRARPDRRRNAPPEITDLSPPAARVERAEPSPAGGPNAAPPSPIADLLLEDGARPNRPSITAESGLSSLFAGSRKNDAAAQAQSKLSVVAVTADLKRLEVSGGRDQAFSPGARLELCRNGRWIGDVRVVTVFDTLSACEILHHIARPEIGDAVRSPAG